MRRTTALVVALPLSLTACLDGPVLPAGEAVSLDGAVVDALALRGLSRDPSSGNVHVLAEGSGIIELDEAGDVVTRFNVNERGLLDLPYRDIASLGDGRFLLIADNEGYLYDALTEQHRVHFCVEPGFVECFDENGNLIDENNNGTCDWDEAPVPGREPGIPLEPVIVQRNDALALVGGEVVAAPRFYEQGARVEASLRSYNIATGEPTGAVDLSALPIELTGLAPAAGALVGVGRDRLVRFDTAGIEVARAVLEGVGDAAGVIADGDDGLLVLDAAARTIVRFTVE